MRTTALSSRRQVVARTCLVLALLLFLAGSAEMVWYFVNLGWSNTTPESAMGVLLLWPVLMIVVAVLAGLALWAARRGRWTWAVAGASVFVTIVPIQLALNGATFIGQQLPVMGPSPSTIIAPYSGGALTAIVASFLAVDAVALYVAWRVARRIGRTPGS